MTSDEQKRKLAIVGASIFWREPIPQEVVQMYADELSDISPDQLIIAINEIKKDTDQKRLPLPALIRSFAKGSNDVLDDARLAASNILGHISKSGPYACPIFSDVEKEVITRMGGWRVLCESVDYDNMTTTQAQMRDIALSVLKNGIRKRAFTGGIPKEIGDMIKKALPLME